jgi:hypothetical protein
VGTLSFSELVPVPDGKAFPDGNGNNPQPPVDCVCVLGNGVCLNLRTGDDVPIHFVDAAGATVDGWQWIATPALTLIWLHAEMPRISRAASISLPYFAPQPHHINYMQSQSR